MRQQGQMAALAEESYVIPECVIRRTSHSFMQPQRPGSRQLHDRPLRHLDPSAGQLRLA